MLSNKDLYNNNTGTTTMSLYPSSHILELRQGGCNKVCYPTCKEISRITDTSCLKIHF